jgi:hypothetical protein
MYIYVYIDICGASYYEDARCMEVFARLARVASQQTHICSMCQHTSAYAYVSIHQHTSAYVSICQHVSIRPRRFAADTRIV